MSQSLFPDKRQPQQFVRLLTRHEKRVFAYIMSLVANWSDAQDIQQETNVRLWEQFDKYQEGTDFGAWACTIAYYQVLSHRERTGRDRLQFSQEFLDRIADDAAAIADEYEPRQHALAECMQKLNQPARTLIRMIYEGDLTIKEVAQRLGRPITATYKAVSRIRLALHECVERTLQNEKLV